MINSLPLIFSLGTVVAFSSFQASAATYNLSFSQSGPSIPFVSGNAVGTRVSLINDATGDSSIPGFTLLAGDMLNVSLQLNSSVTLLPGLRSDVQFSIRPATGNSSQFPGQGFYNQVDSFFNNGVSVQVPNSFGYYTVSGGIDGLALGGAAFSTSTPLFSFNSAMFTVTMQSTGSFIIGGAGPGISDLVVQTFSPVPEPASLALLIAGLLPICLRFSKRKSAKPI